MLKRQYPIKDKASILRKSNLPTHGKYNSLNKAIKVIYSQFKGNGSPLLQRIVKNFSISFAGSIGLMILSLLRTALLTKTLTILDYGRILIVINLVGFLINFLSFRVEDLIFRFLPKFEEIEDIGSIRGLTILGLILSASIGLIVTIGLFVFAPWLSENIYHDPELTFAFRAYSFTALLLASEGFSASILRIKDRFASVVIPRVSGALIVVLALFIYLNAVSSYSISVVVIIISLEIVLQTVLPFIQALRCVFPYLIRTSFPAYQAIRRHRRELLLSLFNTNLYGYLNKLTGPPGDVFLLGIFASPTQVAIYNIAQQIVRAVIVLQNNINTALAPEIVSLWAKEKLHQLQTLIVRFSRTAFIGGLFVMVIGFFLARPVILMISSEEYLDSVYVLYVLIIKVYLTFATLPFYTLTLSMDLISRRNIVLFVQSLILTLVIVYSLTAFRMAVIQLLGAIFVVIICDLYVMMKLKEINHNKVLNEV